MHVLCSYPRSGSNLMATVMERLSLDNSRWFHKAHHPYPEADSLLLVLRDPLECILSTWTRRGRHPMEWKGRDRRETIRRWHDLILAYDVCEKPRMIVYYEDMMTDLSSVCTQAGLWMEMSLGFHGAEGRAMIMDPIIIREEASAAYLPGRITSGMERYHQMGLSRSSRMDAWAEAQDYCYPLWSKYCMRYGPEVEEVEAWDREKAIIRAKGASPSPGDALIAGGSEGNPTGSA